MEVWTGEINSDYGLWMLRYSRYLPSGKLLHNYGKSTIFLMGKFTIPMAIFNSRLWVYQRVRFWMCHDTRCPSSFAKLACTSSRSWLVHNLVNFWVHTISWCPSFRNRDKLTHLYGFLRHIAIVNGFFKSQLVTGAAPCTGKCSSSVG